jgi:SAM-dependent methyltransferase
MSSSYQYQTFEDAPGMVDSYTKLVALKFPPLVGKSFFDVGCNEGYYCGVALAAGATRVVGLDSFGEIIGRARRRFPAAEFLYQSWDTFPDEKFDVVLCASALHYISTVDALRVMLSRLGSAVAPGGLLILELGISNQEGAVIEAVKRRDGTVYYPTMTQLAWLFARAELMWRPVGQSVPGDGYPRVVIHCRPVQYSVVFVRGPSGVGKSYLANSLSSYNPLRLCALDSLLPRIFTQLGAEHLIQPDDWPAAMLAIERTLEPEQFGRIAELLCADILERASKLAENKIPRQDPIIIDGFVPEVSAYEAVFVRLVAALNAKHVRTWDLAGIKSGNEGRITGAAEPEATYVDFGGYRLPLAADGRRADLVEVIIDDEGMAVDVRVQSDDRGAPTRLVVFGHDSGPVAYSEPAIAIDAALWRFRVSLRRVLSGGASADVADRVAALRAQTLHYAVVLSNFSCIFAHQHAATYRAGS